MKLVTKPRSRSILLPEGKITVLRHVFECPRCRRSHALLDAELGLKAHGNHSLGVRQLIAWKGASMSFAEVSADLLHCHGLEVSAAEAARTAHDEGRRIAEVQGQKEERWSEPIKSDRRVFPPERQCQRLVLEADGTVVLTRPGEEHKTLWVGRAFGLEQRGKDSGGRPLLTESRYAAGAGTLDEFKASIDALANRMGARSAQAIAAVADGAPGLWRMLEEALPGAVLIQDYWHVNEHLWGLAKSLHGDGDAAKEEAKRWGEMLYDGRVKEIIEELEYRAKKARGEKRDRLLRERGYLEAGRERMDYPRYRREGWPIGSGAVEGACKHLVKERFAKTGARWKRDELGDVLALRLAKFNDEWDQYWMQEAA